MSTPVRREGPPALPKIGQTNARVVGEAEVVVIGSGSSGATAAARLAEGGVNVWVLEQGPAEQSELSKTPGLNAQASEDGTNGWRYFVSHFTNPVLAARDSKLTPKGIDVPRGAGPGGSSLVNAMITVINGYAEDFNALAEKFGNHAFKAENVLRIIRDNENNHYRPVLRGLHQVGKKTGIKKLQNRGNHGFGDGPKPLDGMIHTRRASVKPVLQDPQLARVVWATFYESIAHELRSSPTLGTKTKTAVAQMLRAFQSFDPNDSRNLQGARSAGPLLFPIAVKPDGTRSGPQDLLQKASELFPDHLHRQADARVDQIVFDDNGKAVAVEFLSGKHISEADPHYDANAPFERLRVNVTDKVILAAGALESPLVLKRSGIGPANELREHGIDVRFDNPEVGTNLHHRYEVGMVCEFDQDFRAAEGALLKASMNDPYFREFKQTGKGLYAGNGAGPAYSWKSRPDLVANDMFFFMLPAADFEGYTPGYSEKVLAPRKATGLLLRARNENAAGTVKLKSADPRQTGDVEMHFHEEARRSDGTLVGASDEEPIADAFEMLNRIFARSGAKAQLVPGPAVKSIDQIERWIRENSWDHHPASSNAIGKAVDGSLKAYGTQNVFEPDLAVFPDHVGQFPWMAAMVMGQILAEQFLAEAKEKSAQSPETLGWEAGSPKTPTGG